MRFATFRPFTAIRCERTDRTAFIAFSPEGMSLATGGGNTVILWDTSQYIMPLFLMSDFDGDGAVGFPDFLLFVAQFGLSQNDEAYDRGSIWMAMAR